MIDHSPFTLQNNGEGTFTQQAISFKQKHWGSAPFADIDADGDRDTRSTIELGDFNNDGKTDVLLNGFSGLYARNVALMCTS